MTVGFQSLGHWDWRLIPCRAEKPEWNRNAGTLEPWNHRTCRWGCTAGLMDISFLSFFFSFTIFYSGDTHRLKEILSIFYSAHIFFGTLKLSGEPVLREQLEEREARKALGASAKWDMTVPLACSPKA